MATSTKYFRTDGALLKEVTTDKGYIGYYMKVGGEWVRDSSVLAQVWGGDADCRPITEGEAAEMAKAKGGKL